MICTATVVFLTHLPQETIPSPLQENGFDKLAHVLAYGVITFLFILSVRTSFCLLSAAFLFFAILAIGATDEITQPLINRTASLADWLANVTGIVIVLLFGIVLKVGGQSSPNSQHMIRED